MKQFDILHSKLIIIPVFLASIVASVYLLQIVFNFLSQFGWLFIIFIYAYFVYVFVDPIDKVLKDLKVSPKISLYLSFAIILALLLVIIVFLNPVISQELITLTDKLKTIDLNTTFGSFIEGLSKTLNIDYNQLRDSIFERIRTLSLDLTTDIINVLSNALFTIVQLVLALIFGYFFIKDGRTWFKGLLKLIPVQYSDEVNTIVSYFNKSAVAFLRVQVYMAFIYGVINFILMNVLGIQFALTSSIVAFLTFIIPGVGPILSVLIPITVTFLFDVNKVWILVILLLVFQQIILNILVPKVYGDKMGVHPIIILLSILVGVQLFGILGAFIAIPVITVAINVATIYYNKVIEK